jgi:hypothetical protein
MDAIPEPELLDPQRVLTIGRDRFVGDHEARANQLEDALRKTCAYAQDLWRHLDATRSYLYDSLPPDPHERVGAIAGASPSGPDDAAGWDRWIDAYARTTSILAGPHGDSGYGRQEATREADRRRLS